MSSYDPRYQHKVSAELLPKAEQLVTLDGFCGKLDSLNQQFLIPFLGAGASLLANTRNESPKIIRQPNPQDIDRICAEFDIREDASKLFVNVALQLAQLLDPISRKANTTAASEPQFTKAPSSWELANFLTQKLQQLTRSDDYVYEPIENHVSQLLELLPQDPTKSLAERKKDYLGLVRAAAELLNLHRSIPELLTIASYFPEGQWRELLRRELQESFARIDTETAATRIQRRLVEKAARFVGQQNEINASDKPDYVIITTNYDCLIEDLLDQAEVPTCAITVGLDYRIATDLRIAQKHLDLTDNDFNENVKKKYQPTNMVLARSFLPTKKMYSLAMVYKLHGCPRIDRRDDDDNIVIADRDYVQFMQRSGEGAVLIPAYIRNRIKASRFLFLGYSFSDWNVRGLKENKDAQTIPRCILPAGVWVSSDG